MADDGFMRYGKTAYELRIHMCYERLRTGWRENESILTHSVPMTIDFLFEN